MWQCRQRAENGWSISTADDWIAPEKCAMQLDALSRDPALDIIGTWVHAIDADGGPHPAAVEISKGGIATMTLIWLKPGPA